MNKPKIIIFDIETSGNTVYTFQIGRKVNISPEQILKEGKIICICWKVMGEKKVHSLQWDGKQNDKAMLAKFVEVANSADLLLAHNGDRFDIRKLNARIIYHRLSPMTNITSIDTLKLGRSNFAFNSQRLDYVCKYLGFEGKMEHSGLQLWLDVEKGDSKALNKMVKYCKQDVTELENYFKTILPYCKSLPVNMSLLVNGTTEGCPNCGSQAIQKFGIAHRKAGSYQKYLCTTCRHVFKDSKQLRSIDFNPTSKRV